MKNLTPPVHLSAPSWWRRLLLVCALLLVSVWAGCRSPQERYRVLSFFLDGVPNPDAPVAGVSGAAQEQKAWAAAAAGAPAKEMFAHPGFKEEACGTCHDPVSRALMAEPGKSPCLRCHEPLTRQFPIMHGPVAVGECQLCHRAHDADNPSLLRSSGPKLCRDCHDELASPPREHEQADANCLGCHLGHGSSQRFLLRPAKGADHPAADQPEEQSK